MITALLLSVLRQTVSKCIGETNILKWEIRVQVVGNRNL